MDLARFAPVRFAHLPKGETVVFLHTGGAQGLCGYASGMRGKL